MVAAAIVHYSTSLGLIYNRTFFPSLSSRKTVLPEVSNALVLHLKSWRGWKVLRCLVKWYLASFQLGTFLATLHILPIPKAVTHASLVHLGTTTPLSGFGKFVGGVTALFGVFTITLPVPIVVNSFSNFYKTRLWRSEVALKRRERLIHSPGTGTKDSAHIELNGVQ